MSTDVEVNITIKGIDEKALVKSLTDKVKTTNMHAFNSKCVITKYATLNDILKEFADVRLTLYETRRQHQIKALKAELPYHVNVVRFIQDQISDEPEIHLHKKSRADCDEILGEAEYQHVDGNYDYIMKLPVSSFTLEEIKKHETKLANLRREIAELETKKAAELWLSDLQNV